jgi:MFS family permease
MAAGWRTAAFVCALVFCAVTLVTAQFIRTGPEQYGLRPDGDPGEPEAPPATDRRGRSTGGEGASVAEALRMRAFWMLLISNMMFSFTTSVNHVHQIPNMRSRGFTASGAAFVTAAYGVEQAFGRFLSGWVGDRIGRHRLFRLSFLLLGLGWVSFAFISPANLWTVVLYLATMGLGHATHNGSAGSQVADYFGTRRQATIRGVMSSITFIGGVIGPTFAGYMYDRTGSYAAAFFVMGPCIALGLPAMLMAGEPTRAGFEGGRKARSEAGASTGAKV